MYGDDEIFQFNFKFSQCQLLDDNSSITADDHSNKHQVSRPIDILEEHLEDLKIYENQLSAFCGLWTDYPHKYYRMDFRIEMGQLIGYSNVHHGKALASYDGRIINMIIVYRKESGRQLKRYRGRLGWNKQYIVWEKEDLSVACGWRSTRRWIKIE